jgi:hypothetical protein
MPPLNQTEYHACGESEFVRQYIIEEREINTTAAEYHAVAVNTYVREEIRE